MDNEEGAAVSKIRMFFDWIIRRHIRKLIGEQSRRIEALVVGRYPRGSVGEAELKLDVEWWELKIEAWRVLAGAEKEGGDKQCSG